MYERKVGFLAWLVIVTTSVWVGLTIYQQVSLPPSQTLIEKIQQIESGYLLFVINYVNAGLITLGCTALFAGFYVICRKVSPLWSAVALVFVPIYGIANLAAYLSQVFVVPGLIEMSHASQTEPMAMVLLSQLIHEWPGSAMQFLNGLAYAVLGIPSILFGSIFWQKKHSPKLGSGLLILSGLLSLLALIGIGLRSPVLMSLSLASGFIFLVSLISIAAYLLRKKPSENSQQATQ